MQDLGIARISRNTYGVRVLVLDDGYGINLLGYALLGLGLKTESVYIFNSLLICPRIFLN